MFVMGRNTDPERGFVAGRAVARGTAETADGRRRR